MNKISFDRMIENASCCSQEKILEKPHVKECLKLNLYDVMVLKIDLLGQNHGASLCPACKKHSGYEREHYVATDHSGQEVSLIECVICSEVWGE